MLYISCRSLLFSFFLVLCFAVCFVLFCLIVSQRLLLVSGWVFKSVMNNSLDFNQSNRVFHGQSLVDHFSLLQATPQWAGSGLNVPVWTWPSLTYSRALSVATWPEGTCILSFNSHCQTGFQNVTSMQAVSCKEHNCSVIASLVSPGIRTTGKTGCEMEASEIQLHSWKFKHGFSCLFPKAQVIF